MGRARYSVKWTGFLVPLIPGLYKIHSIMWTLTSLSHFPSHICSPNRYINARLGNISISDICFPGLTFPP